MAAAYSTNGGSFAAAKPRPWSNTQISDIGPSNWNLDVAPDGSRFVVAPRADPTGKPSGSAHVTFLLNFFDEVRRRIPAGK